MATYSPHPVFVDGVRLDSSAWNVTTKTRSWASSRSADVVIPGVDGVAASLNDDFEPATLTLSMWALGTDENGLVPSGFSAMSKVRDNLDQLAHLFGKRHALLNVSEVVDTNGNQRQAYAKVADVITPEVTAGARATFTVTLTLPEGMWQDVSASNWTASALVSGNVYEATPLQGSTGPISDAIFCVTGPATNPELRDATTNAYLRLNMVLAAGTVWRVNSGTWATRYGVGLTPDSLDTAGVDANSVTVFGGGNSRFLRLVPQLSSNARRVQVSLGGTGFSSATAVSIRARRKFLQ
jgi:hypothetical protein